MSKKLSLVLLSLCSLCFGMSRVPQQRGGYVADRLRAAWKRSRKAWNERLNQLFTKNANVMLEERQKIARSYANLRQEQAKLREIESNAQKEFDSKSWLKWLLFGKASSGNKERQQNALETMRKTQNQWMILKNKESILNERKRRWKQKAEDMARYYQNRAR
jgi:hypothetical protein